MFQRILALCALGVVLSAPMLHAQPNLFVLPGAGSSNTVSQAFTVTPVTTNNPIPITNFRTFSAGAGAFDILPNSIVSNVFLVSSAATNSITSTDLTLIPSALVANLSPVPTQAVMTPDQRILAVAAGNVHLFDTGMGAELVPGGLNQATGMNTVAVATSLDSSTIFALATNAGGSKLSAISTATYAFTGTLPFNQAATALSVGPNGLVYVSMADQVVEVDPRTLLPTFNGQMPLVDFTPGTLVFTPDGQYALAINQSGVGGNLLVLTLSSHTATVPNIGVAGIAQLKPIGIDTVIAVTTSGLIYQLSVSPPSVSGAVVNVVGPAAIPGIGARGVIAVATSNDVPNPKHSTVTGVFLAAQSSVYQFVPSSQSVYTPAPLGPNVTPGVIRYAVPPETPARGAPASLLIYGSNQNILPGAVSEPLVAQVLDQNAVPISGVFVQFQITANGNGATLSTTSAPTGAGGYAVTYLNSSQTTSLVTVTASVNGYPVVPANYQINVTPTAQGAGGNTLTIISGQGDLMEESTNTDLGGEFGAPLKVLATDPSGKPVANLPVTFTVPPTAGTLFYNNTGSSTQVINTDATGVASVDFLTTSFPPAQFAQGYFQTTITASAANAKSVTFYNTDYPSGQPPGVYPLPPAAGTPLPLIGGEGTVIPGALRVQVISTTGKYVPHVSLFLDQANSNAAIYPTAQCNAPNGLVLSDINGIASCDILFGPRVGTSSFSYVVGYTRQGQGTTAFTVVPGPPATIQIIQGNNQTGLPGQTLPLALRIHVADSAGNTIQGAPVTWQAVTPGTVTFTNVISATDSIGDASALAILGSIGGPVQVKVSAGGASATFDLVVNIPTAGLQKVSGDQQTATINTAFTLPLVVKTVNSSGNAVSGAQVAFAVTAGDATVGSATAVTDSNGQASTTVTAGATAGAITVTATSATFSVNFSLTSLLPGPQNITIINGASFNPNTGVAPGGIATIRGMGLLPGVSGVVPAPVTNGQYPTTFSGVTIKFDGTPAPIYYVSDDNGADQISVQVPFEVQPGPAVSLEVDVANEGSTTVSVPIKPLAPGVFTSVYNGKTYAVAVRPDGSQVSPTNPAQRGETIQLYITGLGQTDPAIATNTPGVANQTMSNTLIVGLNNGGVPLQSSVYAPGLVGIYIVIMDVPKNTKTGPYQPIGIVAYDSDKNAYFSQATYIPIQ